MSIKYTYTILSIDDGGRSMQVRYEAEGYQTMIVGVRLPFVGESLEQVIDQFSPVNYWIAMTAPVVIPEIGITGNIDPTPQVVNTEPVDLDDYPLNEV